MPEKKNQHYVPRFYLKKFSDENKARVNLYNISRGMLVEGASIKGQCVEPYFYGKNSDIENLFGDIEAIVSKVIERLLVTNRIPDRKSPECHAFLFYIILQHYRTKHAVEQNDETTDKLIKAFLRHDPNLKGLPLDRYKITLNNAVALNLLIASSIYWLAFDLDAKIIANSSSEDFITSDSPVVFYNQYMESFRGASCTGLTSQGLQVFFPLSPKIMFHLYDPKIYKVAPKNSSICDVQTKAEALKFNELQWLNALENVYFSRQSTGASIVSQAKRFLPRRTTGSCKVDEYPFARPNGGGESMIVQQGVDLKTRLRPSFVSILKSKKRALQSLKVPQVRSQEMLNEFFAFEREVKAGNYRPGDVLKFLRRNKC